MNVKTKKLLVYIGIFTVGGILLLWTIKPEITETAYVPYTYNLQSADCLFGDGRQAGDISLDKFIDLASKYGSSVFNPSTNVIRQNDSVTFSSTTPSIFFGVDDGKWWRKKYKTLPISFPDEYSFRAAVHTKDSAEYIYIPYQILLCLASSSPEIQYDKPNQSRTVVRDSTITLNSPKEVEAIPCDGSKIQIEGIVFQHVADVLQSNGGKGKTKREQLVLLWDYARKNWLYITDPYTGADTWRSASETIEAYYFAQKRGYSGDCDDFAILMASFARQLGFKSKVVAAFNNEGGHAYAEFEENNGRWTRMDWFSDKFGDETFKFFKKKEFDDI